MTCRSVLVAMIALVLAACTCNESSETSSSPAASGSVTRRALSPEMAGQVLAEVGGRRITLGDYVAVLERMDPFERLRYQTPERRKLLLDEMINVELLAREAERRGLDKEPTTEAYLRQLMREEMLRELRAEGPGIEDIPAEQVEAYYEQHQDEFADPERRRVAAISVGSAKKAKELLEQLRDGNAARWGELARAHSLLPSAELGSRERARPPLELEGDLGLVSAPKEERGRNPRVPSAVRSAVFEIEKPGDIHSEVIPARGRFYLVRLVSISPARKRTLAEAETTIRVQLVQEAIRKRERALQKELRRTIPVQINEVALAELEAPEPGPGVDPAVPEPSASPAAVPSSAPVPSGHAP